MHAFAIIVDLNYENYTPGKTVSFLKQIRHRYMMISIIGELLVTSYYGKLGCDYEHQQFDELVL